MEAWRSLIRRAVARLEAVGLRRDEWTWGGGTVLMLRYRHRFSRDVDLFIDDVQYLSYLSPRLSDHLSADILEYSEQANHLRLEYPEGEIDFLAVAPVFPDLKPIHEKIDGVDSSVRLTADEERGYREIDRPSLSVSFPAAREALLDWIGRDDTTAGPAAGL